MPRRGVHRRWAEWFIDDEEGVVHAEVAERWLRLVNQALANVRTGDECKSVACLCVLPDREHEFSSWASEYIGAACKVRRIGADVRPEGTTYAGMEKVVALCEQLTACTVH